MVSDDRVAVLARTEPFDMLDGRELERVAEVLEERVFAPGEFVFRQGDASRDGLFVVASGLVEITLAGEKGEASVVGHRRAFDFFGETVVLSRERYPGAARAREATRCYLLPRRELESLIYRVPEFSGFFNALLAERMRLLYTRLMADLSWKGVPRTAANLFRSRVGDIMSSPVVTCPPEMPVVDAARLMADHGTGSVVVVGAGRKPLGVLTPRTVLSHLVHRPTQGLEGLSASAVMDGRVHSIEPGAKVAEALAAMTRLRTRRLLVVERGAMTGIVSRSDMVRAQGSEAVILARRIDWQQTPEGLAALGRSVDATLGSLMAGRVEVAEVLAVMGELHDRITCRVLELCEEGLLRDGWGRPPAAYCWINMGSAARHEQTLRTDQDNALIFADPPPDDGERGSAYFAELADRAVAMLAACGFALCTGGVMANRPEWRRSLSAWIDAAEGWVASPRPEDARALTILLDFRPVWGDADLGNRLRDHMFDAFRRSEAASHLLAKDDRQLDIPLSMLGAVGTKKSGPYRRQIDLKASGLAPMVNGIRLFAVNRSVHEPSTLGRLDALAADGILAAEDVDLFRASFQTLRLFKIRGNLEDLEAGRAPDNHIDPRALSRAEQSLLRDALHGASRLRKLVNRHYGLFWLDFFGS